MKAKQFIKEFDTYEQAFDRMLMLNRAFKAAKNDNDTACVVPGPDDNYACVDLKTAIELGLGYVWSYNGFSANPWAAKS